MFREFTKEDRAFVASSWTRSFQDSNWAGILNYRQYWAIYPGLVDQILDDPNTKVLICCNPEDQDQVFGFVAYEESTPITLHYMYLKPLARNSSDPQEERPDLALKMLQTIGITRATPFTYTFRTPHWEKFRYRVSSTGMNCRHDTKQLRSQKERDQ